MSWFFCVWDLKGISDLDKEYRPNLSIEYKVNSIFLELGGSKSTHHYNINSETGNGWMVCGIGILNDENKTKIMELEDWKKLLDKDVLSLDKIDGHYVILKFSNSGIGVYTDKLGLRDVYYAKIKNRYYLSTRIEWISKYVKTDLDVSEFGSRWLLFNQLSNKSILKNITRLVEGQGLEINERDEKIIQYRTKFIKTENLSFDKFKFNIGRLIDIGFGTGKNVSLSLSGGLDSRVLLSYLLLKKDLNWDCHTFGNSLSPDSKVVKKIVYDFNLKHTQYFSDEINQTNTINTIESYAVRSFITNPVSISLQMQYYNNFLAGDNILIDGGFGEIWRREFNNKLLTFGQKYIIEKKLYDILNYIKLTKSNVFEDSIIQIMLKACHDQLEELFGSIPSIEDVGVVNWVDLLAIKTRLPNFYCHEQSKTDEITLNYMVFAQTSLINNFLNVEEKSRTNAKYLKKIIRTNNKKLTKYPLAKTDVVYPYVFGSKMSRLQSKIFRQLNLTFPDTTRDKLFDIVQEYILDLLNSSDTKNYTYYDKKKVNNLEKEFFIRNKKIYSEIDWWLSFELFRRGVNF